MPSTQLPTFPQVHGCLHHADKPAQVFEVQVAVDEGALRSVIHDATSAGHQKKKRFAHSGSTLTPLTRSTLL